MARRRIRRHGIKPPRVPHTEAIFDYENYVAEDVACKQFHLDESVFNAHIRAVIVGDKNAAAPYATAGRQALQNIGVATRSRAAAKRCPEATNNANPMNFVNWAKDLAKQNREHPECHKESYEKAIKQLQCIQATAERRMV